MLQMELIQTMEEKTGPIGQVITRDNLKELEDTIFTAIRWKGIEIVMMVQSDV